MGPLVDADEFRKAARTWRIVNGLLWLIVVFAGFVALGIAVSDDPPLAIHVDGATGIVAGIVMVVSFLALMVNLLVRSQRSARVMAAASRGQPQVQLNGLLAAKAHQAASTPHGTQHLGTSYRIEPTDDQSTALEAKAMMRPDRNSRHGDRVLLQLYGPQGLVGGAVRNLRTNATFIIKAHIPAGMQVGTLTNVDWTDTQRPAAGRVQSMLPPAALQTIARVWKRRAQRYTAVLIGSYLGLILIALMAFASSGDEVRKALAWGLGTPVAAVMMWSLMAVIAHKEIPRYWEDAATQVYPDGQSQGRIEMGGRTFNPLLVWAYHRRWTLEGTGLQETLHVLSYRKYPLVARTGDTATVQWYSSDGDHTPGLLRVDGADESIPIKVST